MRFHIPLWLLWTGGVAAALLICLLIGVILVVGLAEDDRDLDAMRFKPFPDPHRPPQDQL